MGIVDLLFIGLLVLLGIWFIVSFTGSPFKKSPTKSNQQRKSPYEHFITSRTVPWQMKHQKGQILKHKDSLKEALKKGDKVAQVIHKSMIVHRKSVINYFSKLFSKEIQ